MFSAARNMRAAAQTKETLQSFAPSNRTPVQGSDSPAETNFALIDHALCESSPLPPQASPRGRHTDCFRKQGVGTSIRRASSAKPQATRGPVFYLRPSAHRGEIRRRSTSAANSRELARYGEKGARLCRGIGNPYARREQ